MPFPYELYPKAKETHCLNLPEISVSRPPFPGSIRTADGCFWGERDNNSYVSTHKTDRVCTADGKCYNYNDVFVDEVDPGHSNTCGQTCYVACSCNTSNGWYSSCQGTDCYKVVDTRYAGKPNAASASRSLSDIGSISASGANSGISAMASGATTCYKMKTCSEGGYFDSEPAGYQCQDFEYNNKTCYKDCKKQSCSDGGYYSSTQSGMSCTEKEYNGMTCYDCVRYIVSEPCKEKCYLNGPTPHFKEFTNGQKCCCPTVNETNNLKCDCCTLSVTDPCGCSDKGLVYYKYNDGKTACCAEPVAPGCEQNPNGVTCATSCILCDISAVIK